MSSSAGSHESSSPSASQFLSTLIPVLIEAVVLFAVFLVFRTKVRRVYEPRTYLPLLHDYEKTPQPSTSRFGWINDFRSIRDDYILNHSSLDNYLFLRLFKVLAFMCLVGWIITWPILFPVYATGGNGATQFNVVSFTNVNNKTKANYYYATALVAWVYLGFVMLLIARETILFIKLRQAVVLSPSYRTRLSTKTVLFTTVPENLQSEAAMRESFGGVLNVWVQPGIKELTDLVKKRDKAAAKLEGAENKMIKKLIKNRKKEEKKAAKSGEATQDIPLVDNEEGRRHIEVDKKIRPTHRLKFLIGKKVDTIDWARPEIQSLNEQIEATSTKVNSAEKVPAIFVEFDSLESAQAAFSQVVHQKKRQMTPKVLGVQPNDVIWKNLSNKASKIKIISIAATVFVTLMVIFWAIPVAFVGAVSNVQALDSHAWLAWIKDIPSVILGVITGLLPSIMLAVLMALVPIILRLIAGLFMPTHSTVELKVQNWYFAFQVVDVFLVTTFASGAIATAQQIVNDPSSAPELLATNLPLAANFYTCYFVIQMVNTPFMLILNIAPLLFALFLGKILDGTPRKVYNRYTNLIGLGWGSVYPAFTMLGCIALAYSCIAPLLLGFATIGFGLLYLGYRYQLLFVIGNQSIDMQGRAYARALQHLTVGVYLSIFCLVGLFAIGCASSPDCAGPLVLMIIFAVGTIIFHVIMRKTLGPLVDGYELIPGTEGQSVVRDHSLGDTEDGKSGKGQLSPAQSNGAPTTGAMGKLRGKLLNLIFFNKLTEKFASHDHLAPHFDEAARDYTEEEYAEAYLPPAITSRTQTIWMARDEYGLSRQEVAGCEEFGIPVTDEQAHFNEKAAVEWDSKDLTEAPIYEERVPY